MSTFFTMLGCAIALWLVSLKLKDASIADLIWGLWFVISRDCALGTSRTVFTDANSHHHLGS